MWESVVTDDEILLHSYVLVDDWYQANAADQRKGQRGKKPEFSDSEMMKVMVAMDYIPFRGILHNPSQRFNSETRKNGGVSK